jgi:hypothetical protein
MDAQQFQQFEKSEKSNEMKGFSPRIFAIRQLEVPRRNRVSSHAEPRLQTCHANYAIRSMHPCHNQGTVGAQGSLRPMQ